MREGAEDAPKTSEHENEDRQHVAMLCQGAECGIIRGKMFHRAFAEIALGTFLTLVVTSILVEQNRAFPLERSAILADLSAECCDTRTNTCSTRDPAQSLEDYCEAHTAQYQCNGEEPGYYVTNCPSGCEQRSGSCQPSDVIILDFPCGPAADCSTCPPDCAASSAPSQSSSDHSSSADTISSSFHSSSPFSSSLESSSASSSESVSASPVSSSAGTQSEASSSVSADSPTDCAACATCGEGFLNLCDRSECAGFGECLFTPITGDDWGWCDPDPAQCDASGSSEGASSSGDQSSAPASSVSSSLSDGGSSLSASESSSRGTGACCRSQCIQQTFFNEWLTNVDPVTGDPRYFHHCVPGEDAATCALDNIYQESLGMRILCPPGVWGDNTGNALCSACVAPASSAGASSSLAPALSSASSSDSSITLVSCCDSGMCFLDVPPASCSDPLPADQPCEGWDDARCLSSASQISSPGSSVASSGSSGGGVAVLSSVSSSASPVSSAISSLSSSSPPASSSALSSRAPHTYCCVRDTQSALCFTDVAQTTCENTTIGDSDIRGIFLGYVACTRTGVDPTCAPLPLSSVSSSPSSSLRSSSLSASSSPRSSSPPPASSSSSIRACGDGVVQSPEQCDQGTVNSNLPNAACRTDCMRSRCGDSIVDPLPPGNRPQEECDSGSRNADANPATCSTQCKKRPLFFYVWADWSNQVQLVPVGDSGAPGQQFTATETMWLLFLGTMSILLP